jgi:hypothetical protein
VLKPLMTRCAPGPAAGAEGQVVVSVTDFRPNHLHDAPRVIATGLRLRLGWYAMRGAVGLWLWSLPLARRSGSISVWTSEEDLRGFVGLPAHVEIMRRYRDRGSLRSETWVAKRFASAEILDHAREWIWIVGQPR